MSILYYPEKANEIYQAFYRFGKKYKNTHYSLPEGPETRFGTKYTEDIKQLNWLSLEDLEDHVHLLNSEQRRSLEAILNPDLHKRENKIKPFSKANVLENILGAVGNLKNYAKVIKCCTRGSKGSNPFRCDCRKYCDWCAGKKRIQHKLMYSSAYDSFVGLNFYFITLYVPDHLQTTNFATIEARWNKLKSYVSLLKKHKVLSGGLMTEELSINHLHPKVEVNPHIHILAASKYEITSFDIKGITVHINPVQSREHWNNCINYLTKACNFSDVYSAEWTKENAEELNTNFIEIAQTYRVMLSSRAQSKAFGIFHSNNKNNIINQHNIEEAKKERKKACKTKHKKIKYIHSMYSDFERGVKDSINTTTLPPATTSMLKSAYAAYGPEGMPEATQNSNLFGKLLGAGAALGGSYLYGKYGNNGNNFLSGFSSGVDNHIINPLSNFIDPLRRKLSPAYKQEQDELWQQALPLGVAETAVNNTLQGYINNGSGLHGTPFHDATKNQFDQKLDNITGSTPVQAAMWAPVGGWLGSKMIPKSVANSSMFSSLRPAGSLLSRAAAPISRTAFAINSLSDSNELADVVSDKFQFGDTARATTKGVSMLGGLGAMLGGARLGTKLLGGPGKMIGGFLGSLAPLLINSFRKQNNSYAFNSQLADNTTNTWYNTFKNALPAKDAGNGSPLKAFYNSLTPEQLNMVKAKAENPFIAHQMENLKQFAD